MAPIRVDILDNKQAQNLSDCLQGQYLIIWLIGCTTGLRVSDVLNMSVKQCTQAQAYIKEKKTKKRRRVYISKEIRELSAKRAEKLGLKEHDNLFNVSRQSVWKAFKRAATKASIKQNIGTHTMRKTYSKRYIGKGHSIFELKQRLNHSHLGDTLGYITSNSDMGLDQYGKTKRKGKKK